MICHKELYFTFCIFDYIRSVDCILHDIQVLLLHSRFHIFYVILLILTVVYCMIYKYY